MNRQQPTSNPFSDITVVRKEEMFFGRRDVLQKMFGLIDSKQSVSLTGLRHIGKSSLIHRMVSPKIQHEKQKTLFVRIDFREIFPSSPQEFFKAVCKGILENKVTSTVINGDNEYERFNLLLDDIKQRGYRLVLFIESVERIAQNEQFDKSFFDILRAKASHDFISYVIPSIKELNEIFPTTVTSSPFFNVFHTCRLGPLTREEAQALIMQPGERIGSPFDQGEVEWVLTQAGRNPFFLQRTAYYVFEAKYLSSNKSVNFTTLKERIYRDLLPHFDTIWEDLSEQQQQDLKRERHYPVSSAQELPELSESLLFRRYLGGKFVGIQEGLTIKNVREALDNLDDTASLARCRLSEMHYVYSRGTQTTASSVNQRGIAVREFLKAGFERMRAEKVRSDSAPEWKYYNILYYHNFRYRLRNEQIASRLEIASMRQFYRELERAIELLLKELLELDAQSIKDVDNP